MWLAEIRPRDTPFTPRLRLPQHQEPRDGRGERELDSLTTRDLQTVRLSAGARNAEA